jgi:hypothetical protein
MWASLLAGLLARPWARRAAGGEGRMAGIGRLGEALEILEVRAGTIVAT